MRRGRRVALRSKEGHRARAYPGCCHTISDSGRVGREDGVTVLEALPGTPDKLKGDDSPKKEKGPVHG